MRRTGCCISRCGSSTAPTCARSRRSTRCAPRTIVAQIGAALDAAHARRLVHRDVKPANVLIAPGDHAYLTDFGLVKALDESTAHTGTGTLVGTLDYVAPERIRGEGDGPAADLYSLGCVLYFTLTGAVPFPLEGTERKLWAHLSEPPPRLGSRSTP